MRWNRGADEGSETRSSLMWETIKIIKNMGVWKPHVVIWENVKNVLSKHMRKNFDRYLSEMEKMGYQNSYAVLDARDFGLPQKRQRVFTISILGGPAFDFDRLHKVPMKPLKDFLDDNWQSCHVIKSPSMLSRIGKNDSETFSGILRVLVPDDDSEAAECVTTKQDRCPNSGVIPVDEHNYRLLTEKECWLLQGFSEDDYLAAKSVQAGKDGFKNSSLYKQAGNSMPVPILESIFEVVLKDEMKDYLVTQPSILRGIGTTGINRTTVIEDEAYTITTRPDRCPAQVIKLADGLYRFLTERESWRLMGFTDEDVDAALGANPKGRRWSNAVYKQAGNSMPVPVLEAIFKELIKGVRAWKEVIVGER